MSEIAQMRPGGKLTCAAPVSNVLPKTGWDIQRGGGVDTWRAAGRRSCVNRMSKASEGEDDDGNVESENSPEHRAVLRSAQCSCKPGQHAGVDKRGPLRTIEAVAGRHAAMLRRRA